MEPLVKAITAQYLSRNAYWRVSLLLVMEL